MGGKERFRAGLLETLGPSLEISGDFNDFAPDEFQSLKRTNAANDFINLFLSLKGESPRQASNLDKTDVIKVFKEVFQYK